MAFSTQNERLRQMLLQAFGYPELVDLFIQEVTTINSDEIADDAVTTSKIADLAVTTEKLEGSEEVTAYLDEMVGDSGSGGTKGLVPAPASGDAAALKFLKADGTWAVAASSGVAVGDEVSGGNVNYILFEGTDNLLAEDAKLQFNGTNMSVDAGLTLGAIATSNFELDIRGGAGNATIQLSNTASNTTSADGAIFDFDGVDLSISNREATGRLILTQEGNIDIHGPGIAIIPTTGQVSLELTTSDTADANIFMGSGGGGAFSLRIQDSTSIVHIEQNANADMRFVTNSAEAARLTATGNWLVQGALGVGNSAAATIPGTVTKKIEVFDESGVSLGFIAVYDAIT